MDLQITTVNGHILKEMLLSGANHLCNNKQIVDDLNVFPVPDGDTGTNMSLTISAVKKEFENLEEETHTCSEIADAAANASLRGARGNSGVILSQFLRGLSKGLKGLQEADVSQLYAAMQISVELAYRAVMKPTEGTILTVAREAVEGVADYADSDVLGFMERLVEKAEASLENTPNLLPVLQQAKVVDSGGKGLLTILEGALYYLQHDEVIQTEEEAKKPQTQEVKKAVAPEEIKYGYCTEFLIVKNDKKASWKKLRKKLEFIGDSVIVVDDKDIIKVHVHSNNPGIVLEEAMQLGSLINLKIENMRYQNEQLAKKEAESKPLLDYGFVSVASGDGIMQMFEELGCQSIIEGGQTMNPSTEDILQRIDEINAKTIYVLPNNKNIILAAEQAVKLTGKKVVVIPTRSVVQGIAAMLAFEPGVTQKENTKAMKEALKTVSSGSVTFAARDSEFEDMHIKQGDIMGLVEGKIRVINSDVAEVCMEIISKMVTDQSAMISLYYGKDVKEKQATQLSEQIAAQYPDCEVNLYPGGQPLYYYFIAVE